MEGLGVPLVTLTIIKYQDQSKLYRSLFVLNSSKGLRVQNCGTEAKGRHLGWRRILRAHIENSKVKAREQTGND